jgi:glycerate dehydrogenase
MPRQHIVVTYRATDEEKALIASTLADRADFTFLKDLPRRDRLAPFGKADALISWFPAREYPEGAYGLMKNVRLLQMVSAGVDHVDIDLLPAHVRIAANVGAYAQPMAEHVLAMILAVYKRLPWKHAKLAAGEFDQLSLNRTLRGSVCAILGYGGIGKAVADILRPLGVRIHAVNSTGTTDQDVEFVGTLTDLEAVLRAADIVVVSLALNRSTRGLLGRRQLAWMKDDALLVNVARGDIVDEEALYERLKTHPAFTAAIDAWWSEPLRDDAFRLDHPFFDLPNVLGSPHNSAMVPGALAEGMARAADNVLRFLDGKEPKGIVRREDYAG